MRCRILSRNRLPFSDRGQAGRLLADELLPLSGHHPAVLGIPRGGIVAAKALSDALDGEFDVVLTHKIGSPEDPECAVGAVCESGEAFSYEALRRFYDPEHFEKERVRQFRMLTARSKAYRAILPKLSLKGRTVVVVDDGCATGLTMRAALWAAQREEPHRLIAALPVAPQSSLEELVDFCDEILCLNCPPFFEGVSQFYERFAQVEDRAVEAILKEEAQKRHSYRLPSS